MTKLFSLILTFLATSIGSALAQSYPTRTVNIIITFPPGGPNEGVVRFLAEKLTSSLGQAVIIENRPGGAGELSVQGRSRTRHRMVTPYCLALPVRLLLPR
jgi:tripartite-type tricarboxylate transporter receptor subunit TctC